MRKNVLIKENYMEMSRAAAEVIYSVMEENPRAVIVLATGHSPLLSYRLLVDKIRQTRLDTGKVTFVKLDEWMGLKSRDEATCEYFIREELLKPLAVPEEHYLHFRPEAKDPAAECARVEAEYEKLPKVDLVILGIGMNGHLGLNEPGGQLIGPAHVIALDAKTKTHEMLSHTDKTVSAGITLGMENLFKGEKILLLADGKEKEKGLTYFLNDCITTQVPVSLLKLHRNCQCIINRESFPDMEDTPGAL